MRAAAEAEARWRAGEPRGELDGVPVTIKENVATRGVPMVLGSAAIPPEPAAADAPAAARLREAGAVLVAKTTMPDFGMLTSGVSSAHPTTRQAWNPAWNPGGSSAGAGAAAVAGYAAVHVGTDIGGSVRLPGAWCGVVGFKGSFGRVPVDPPYYARVVGPLTRTVDDAARAMAVLARPDGRDHMSLPPEPSLDWGASAPLTGLRVGLCLDAGAGLPVEPETRAAVEGAAHALGAAGASVEPIAPLITEEMLAGLDRFWRTRTRVELEKLGPDAAARALPYIQQWAAAAAGYDGATVFHGFSQMDAMSSAVGSRVRRGARPAARAGRAGRRDPGRRAVADRRSGDSAGPHRVHGAVLDVRPPGDQRAVGGRRRRSPARRPTRRAPLRRRDGAGRRTRARGAPRSAAGLAAAAGRLSLPRTSAPTPVLLQPASERPPAAQRELAVGRDPVGHAKFSKQRNWLARARPVVHGERARLDPPAAGLQRRQRNALLRGGHGQRMRARMLHGRIFWTAGGIAGLRQRSRQMLDPVARALSFLARRPSDVVQVDRRESLDRLVHLVGKRSGDVLEAAAIRLVIGHRTHSRIPMAATHARGQVRGQARQRVQAAFCFSRKAAPGGWATWVWVAGGE